MARGNMVTAETVISVKKARKQWSDMNIEDIARYGQVSVATARRILNGEYDRLLHKKSEQEPSIYTTAQLKHIEESLDSITKMYEETQQNLLDIANMLHLMCMIQIDSFITSGDEKDKYLSALEVADESFCSSFIFGKKSQENDKDEETSEEEMV